MIKIMFKNFYTTTEADKQIELFRVGYGAQFIIMTIEIFGGQQDGTITLRKYDKDILAFQQTLSINAKSPIVLQHKILMPTNYKYTVQSNVDGINICINAISEINQTIDNNYIYSNQSNQSNNSI